MLNEYQSCHIFIIAQLNVFHILTSDSLYVLFRLSQQLRKHFTAHRDVLNTLQVKKANASTSEQVVVDMAVITNPFRQLGNQS